MKTNLVGWFYIVGSVLFLFGFIGLTLLPIIFSGGVGGVIDSSLISQLGIGVLSLILGIIAFLLGSAFRRHKRWSWYVGIVMVPLVLIGNIIALVSSFQLSLIMIAVPINLFSIYALVSERGLFLNLPAQPTSTNPVGANII